MAPRRWIRLDVGWSDSDWVGGLQPAGRLAWVELLAYVKRDGTAGMAKALTAQAFARKIRVPVADAETMLEAAKADGALVEDETDWTITNWPEYQESDPRAAERMRRYRAERSKLSPLRRNTRNDTVTTRNRGRNPSRDSDSDSDVTEKKAKPLALPKKWRFVPKGWEPNDAHRQLAQTLGLDLNGEAAKYRDHEFKDPKSDPDRTFSNWLRNARPPANGSRGAAKGNRQGYDYSNATDEFKGFAK